MTRARIELTVALVAALALLAGLVTYPGRQVAPVESMRAMERELIPGARPVVDTTLLSGPLDGTIQEAPAPQLPATEVEHDREYIAQVFPALSSWSVTELKPLLSTAALNAISDAELAQVMATLGERLGALRYFDAPQPAGTSESGGYAAASTTLQPYHFTAWYEAGAAEVNLVLEKEPQRSSLYSFEIQIPN